MSTLPSTTKQRFDAYMQAVNRGDAEACLALLHDEYVFHDEGWTFTLRKADMRDTFEWDAATHAQVMYDNLLVNGDQVSGLFTETNDFYTLLGIPQKRFRIIYTFERGLIKDHVFTYVPNGTPSIPKALEPVLPWAAHHHADELAAIYPNEQFSYTGDMGRRWIALLQKWRAANPEP